MKKIFTREILIGLILFFGIAVLFVGIDYLKGINVFKSTNVYNVTFTDVSGLTVASPVTLNGMKIGQVTGIEYDYDNPGHVNVAVDLDRSIKITKGSKFYLTTSILGTAQLIIDMAAGNEYYTNDDIIEGQQKSDLMADISTQVLPEIVKMLPKLTSIVAHIDSLSSNPALMNSINRLDAISKNIELLSARLAETSKDIPPVVDNVTELTGNLSAISTDLKEISSELKNLPLTETMNNIEKTSNNLADITSKVNGKDSSLGMLLNDKGLYNHIDSTVISLDSIIVDLRKNPKKYVNFKLF